MAATFCGGGLIKNPEVIGRKSDLAGAGQVARLAAGSRLTADSIPGASPRNSFEFTNRNQHMKSLKSLIAIGLVQIFAIAASGSAFADPALDQIKGSGVFRVGTEGTYAPFTFHNSADTLVGFDVEIAQEIGKRLGVKVQFIESKWDGLIAGLDANRYDAVINEVTISDARKAKYDFSTPYIVSKAVLIVRSDNSTIKSFADLKGKKSAHTLSSNFARIASDNGAELLGTDGFNQSIDLVISGRADATINDSLSYLDFKHHKPEAKVKIASTLDAADYQGVLIRKGNPDLLAAINKSLADIKADGTYLKISQKYFGTDVSK
ncbi:amino acid ABC transporter substrate-binding protein [Rhodocyclus gracilis]|nr:amino acid ABC transporter substrate-binding protein [Rhodocyclus gracilis]